MQHFSGAHRKQGKVRRTNRRTALASTLGASLAVAALLGPGAAVVAAGNPRGDNGNPPGNNGTVKIDREPFDSHPNNEPHVGCRFEVDFYGYDKGDYWAEVIFSAQPPTGGFRKLLEDRIFIGEDDHSGAATAAGLDAHRAYNLSSKLADIEPHANQGWHVKLTVHADGSQGADTKHKVFWVRGCGNSGGGNNGGGNSGGGNNGGGNNGGGNSGGGNSGGGNSGGGNNGGGNSGGGNSGGGNSGGGNNSGGNNSGGNNSGGNNSGGNSGGTGSHSNSGQSNGNSTRPTPAPGRQVAQPSRSYVGGPSPSERYNLVLPDTSTAPFEQTEKGQLAVLLLVVAFVAVLLRVAAAGFRR